MYKSGLSLSLYTYCAIGIASMEDLFKLWTAYLAVGIEASAGAIIGLAALEAIY
jgi:hypothetical protein